MEVPKSVREYLEIKVTRARQSKEAGDETEKKRYIAEYDSLKVSTAEIYDNLDNIKYLDEQIKALR